MGGGSPWRSSLLLLYRSANGRLDPRDAQTRTLDSGLAQVGQRLQGQPSALRFALGKARRHWRWLRSEGVARLLEEDDLHPLRRARSRWDKRRWRQAHPVGPGRAAPVFVVGLQRSGTNMVVRGLDRAGEFEVRNENDRTAFRRYRLRADEEVQALVGASRARYVLLKPLCDSHRVDRLLALGGTTPRAIWVYREVDGRVRSALAKFGDHDRLVLRAIVAGHGEALWQAQGLSAHARAVLDDVGVETLDPASASALFWWVRNSLVFDLGLHQRSDVLLVSYDAFLRAPAATMRRVTGFLGMDYRPALDAHVAPRSTSCPGRLDLDPRVRALCDELQARLDATAAAP